MNWFTIAGSVISFLTRHGVAAEQAIPILWRLYGKLAPIWPTIQPEVAELLALFKAHVQAQQVAAAGSGSAAPSPAAQPTITGIQRPYPPPQNPAPHTAGAGSPFSTGG